MKIEIRDKAIEARIQKQLQITVSRSVEEVLLHLLETQDNRIVGSWTIASRSTQRSSAVLMNSTAAREFPKIGWMHP